MGFAGQASSWGEPFLAALRPRFTLIRFSNRGTGLSDRPDVQPTIRMMADDAAALLEALDRPKAHVLGISMGGMIAQELVLNHPQRVQGLVLGCTTPGGPKSVVAPPEVLASLMPQPGLSREEQIRKAWPIWCVPRFLEERRDFLEEMLASSLQTPTPIDTIMKQGVAVQGFDAYDRLPQIKAPTLVIHGDSDRLVPPENGRILADRIPGARLHILPDAAHLFFWEHPEDSARPIVEFLSTVPAPA
jgi:3-oxoadipate enol-lactonase